MLNGHILATSLLMGIIALLMVFTITMVSVYTPGLLFIGLLFILVFGVIVGLLSLPYGMLLNFLMKRYGYTKWWDFLFAGLCAGVLLALLTQGLLVDTAPEDNGYVEIFGWERAELFLNHYLKGAFVGIIYAMSYWWVLYRKRPHSA